MRSQNDMWCVASHKILRHRFDVLAIKAAHLISLQRDIHPESLKATFQKIGRPCETGGVIGQISLLARQDLNNLPQADFHIRIEWDQGHV